MTKKEWKIYQVKQTMKTTFIVWTITFAAIIVFAAAIGYWYANYASNLYIGIPVALIGIVVIGASAIVSSKLHNYLIKKGEWIKRRLKYGRFFID